VVAAGPDTVGTSSTMLKDGVMLCDRCQKRISRITDVPAEGWPEMHNLCSTCFAEVKQTAIPR
jgi:predicted amidophosphoribosyltransferase